MALENNFLKQLITRSKLSHQKKTFLAITYSCSKTQARSE